MKVLFISTFLPRKCGIATFTNDLVEFLEKEKIEIQIVAISEKLDKYKYPEKVVFEIPQFGIDAYRDAADYINLSDIDIVCLQHEFGIFGGVQGDFIFHLMDYLKKPVLTTLHTIISKKDLKFKEYTGKLVKVINLSTKVVVMNQKGKELLINEYDISNEKIEVIPHGIPDVPFVDPSYYKNKFDSERKIIILTFGLLSPGKGIETVIESLPPVINKHPNILYFIVGATHPSTKHLYGETYRISLEQRVRQLEIENNVRFYNKFVTDKELEQFISASDIVITPFPNKAQISSGTLSRAVGSGKAIISTPFWHAEELLGNNRGIFVDFNSIPSIRKSLLKLIENEHLRNQLRRKAYDYGRHMIWPLVAKKYVNILEETVGRYTPREEKTFRTYTFPDISLKYIKMLTDSTGIFQHATYGIPNRKEGYSTDDVARALIVVLQYLNSHKDGETEKLINIYLAYLEYAQNEDGLFRNYLSYSHEWLDESGTEDTQGRVIWGLGTAITNEIGQDAQKFAHHMFQKCLTNISNFQYIRPVAYAINGLYEVIQTFPGARHEYNFLKRLADQLVEKYKEESSPDWHWFEEQITYGNAKIPEALLLAYNAIGEEEYRKIAIESLDFLIEVQYNSTHQYFDLIGNKGFFIKNNQPSYFDQQPIDAAYLVTACLTAYDITKDKIYKKYAEHAFEWFYGRNRFNKVLYNFKLECCYDGFDEQSSSINNGAESTICFLLAALKLKKHIL